MILADKIICLRKQKGWSQEELANIMDVSRQSVSKWENESAIPEMDKIVLLSNIFNVSTDYLIKEDVTKDCNDQGEVLSLEVEPVILSSQEVYMYIKEASKFAKYISTGVSTIILGLTILVLMSVGHLNPILNISSKTSMSIGLVVMFLLIARSIFIFIKAKIAKIIIKYGARDCITYLSDSDKRMVEEEKDKYKKTHLLGITYSLAIFIIGAIPLIVGGMYEVSEPNIILLTVLFLVTTNIAIHILIRVSLKIGIFGILLNTN